jgi:hypothetical protein
LKFTARLFVLPVGELLYQPFHVLWQAVGPGSRAQEARISLICEDCVLILGQKLP